MNPLGFIRSLSYGLFHRWDPGRAFVILTAYIDESGTHKGAKQTIVAGYLGHARDWSRFEHRWKKMLAEYEIPYFHAHEAYKRTGTCKGWPIKRRNELFRATERLSHQWSEFGFAVVLPNEIYDQQYKISGKRPKGTAIPDSKYGVCFRYAVSFLGALLQQRYERKDFTLHLVLESGHLNSQDAVRIFDLMKGRESTDYFRKILGTLTYVNKADCYEVQAADGLAYTAYGIENYPAPVEVASHSIGNAWRASKEVTAKQKAGRSNRPIYRLLFNGEQLRELQSHLFLKNPLPAFNFK